MLTAETLKGFVGSCLLKKFDGSVKIPACHEEWWALCCSRERYVAIAAPRRHAKSTAITISFTLASLLFRERRYVMIVSDTEAQATNFLRDIKSILLENEDIIELFQLPKDHSGRVKLEKESETDIILKFDDGHSFRIIAKGAGQPLRGMLWNQTRPDMIIIDDLENDESVMNKDRRTKLKRWFYGTLLNCLNKTGIVRYVGTILHQDSLLNSLMPSPTDRFTVREPLKMWSRKKLLWNSVKYRAHPYIDDYSVMLWKEMNSAEFLKGELEEARRQGLSDIYSQEQLNEPIDEANTLFKLSYFLPLTDKDLEKNLKFYITVDLAVSKKESADYTVFLVAGVDETGRIQVRNVIRERMDPLEVIDTIMTLQRLYEPVAFGIEANQIQMTIAPFLNETMIRMNTFPNIIELSPGTTDKIARSSSIRARMKAGGVKFLKDEEWYLKFEDECIRFPRDKHDDQVDALSYLGLMLNKLLYAETDEEKEEEEYLEETRAGLSQGRNLTTGY